MEHRKDFLLVTGRRCGLLLVGRTRCWVLGEQAGSPCGLWLFFWFLALHAAPVVAGGGCGCLGVVV